MDEEIDLNRYELKEGDIIRIGRIILRLKILKNKRGEKNSNKNNLINISKSCNFSNNYKDKHLLANDDISINTEINLKEINVNSPAYRKKSKLKFYNLKNNVNIDNNIRFTEEKKEHFCRICYGEEEDNDNPLIQPCSCQGSMKYIHLDCLKHWLKTNTYILYQENEFSKSFKCKEAKCELCKEKLPDFIKYKGKLYEITDFGKDFKNYAIFECLTVDKENNKAMHIISLDDNNQLLTIGRGSDCSLILKDVSISRRHCGLRYINKKLFIEDCDSKFGTLIFCHVNIIKLIDNLKLFLQIGRSFIKTVVIKNTCLFSCCNINEINNFDFYYKQNIIKIEHNITVKTEYDFEDDDNGDANDYIHEDKNKKTLESDDEKNTLTLNNSRNKIKIMNAENILTNLDNYASPRTLKSIKETNDENNIEVKISESEDIKSISKDNEEI